MGCTIQLPLDTWPRDGSVIHPQVFWLQRGVLPEKKSACKWSFLPESKILCQISAYNKILMFWIDFFFILVSISHLLHLSLSVTTSSTHPFSHLPFPHFPCQILQQTGSIKQWAAGASTPTECHLKRLKPWIYRAVVAPFMFYHCFVTCLLQIQQGKARLTLGEDLVNNSSKLVLPNELSKQ